jgi:hypothetical protein
MNPSETNTSRSEKESNNLMNSTDTNAQMSGGNNNVVNKNAAYATAVINNDDETLNLEEDFSKSLLTTTKNNHQNQLNDSKASFILHENSTSNDETLTISSANVKNQLPIVDCGDLNVELNQLVEELVESVVSKCSAGLFDAREDNDEVVAKKENDKGDAIVVDKNELDLVVREVLDGILDQIEKRLNENRAFECKDKSGSSDLTQLDQKDDNECHLKSGKFITSSNEVSEMGEHFIP